MTMPLVKKRTRNGDLLPSLRNDLSEFFDIDRIFNEPIWEAPMLGSGRYSRVPATNIRETNDEYIVEVAAPGMQKSDFHVDLDNGLLEIKVEKEEESEEKKAAYSRREYNYNAFCRSFNLPETVKDDAIKAEYVDGILKVHLPKVAEAKRKPAKAIPVK